MIKFCVFLVLLSRSLYSFHDTELMQLWSSIEDITTPTLEEYKGIEKYLKEGDRAYLKPLAFHNRYPLIRNLQLIGVDDEMPVFEEHRVNIDAESENRCIVLYGSYNGIYPEKARNLLSELRKCGYRGHVLLRIGGFPNISNGGLKICHVPYAFKIAALQEAERYGYEQILWLDTALHPITNLEMIFNTIQEKGFFFTSVGFLSDNRKTHLVQAAFSLGITTDHYDKIPHISSSILGLNMKNLQAVQLLKNWVVEAENVYPFITCWPEELSLSVIAWRLGCQPIGWFGNYVCIEHEFGTLQVRLRPLQFYIDARR